MNHYVPAIESKTQIYISHCTFTTTKKSCYSTEPNVKNDLGFDLPLQDMI